MQVRISAIEYSLPSRVETVADMAREHPEWPLERISRKTGVCARHMAGEGETAADLGMEAARKLFASGMAAPEDIDFLLFCTQTPDYVLPTTACIMQDRLGLPVDAGALDFNLGCSGFVYGLGLAKGLIASGQAERILLITSDTYSKLIHPDDRSVRTVFGDGAAATLIDSDGEANSLGPFVFGTDGRGAENLCVPAGGMRLPANSQTAIEEHDQYGNRRSAQNLYMNGREIFLFALQAVPAAVQALADKAGLELEDVDRFVFHQASAKVLEALRRRLHIAPERFFVSMENMGNTVSSTIPIALKQAHESGFIRRGEQVMLVGFGVGYSWGATLVRWNPKG